MDWWMYLILGVAAGVVSASFGVGAGIVMVPALVLIPVFAFKQHEAQGIALCVMVPMALVGAWRYVQDPTIRVDLRVAGLIAAGAVVGAYLGHLIATHLPEAALRKAFAVFIFVVAIRMFFTKPRAQAAETETPTTAAGITAPAVANQQPREGEAHERR